MDPIYSNIAANKRWTYLFFALYAIIIGIIGYTIGLYFNSVIFGILAAVVIFSLALLVSYFGGQSVVTSMAGAKEVSKQDEPYLYNTVEALSIAAGLPMPKLYMIDTDVPNAFAAGRNPENASITVTKGLLDRLDRLELEGVIAHEMAHIRNYDVLLATVAIVLAGTIVFLGFMARYSAYGGLLRGGNRAGPAGIVLLILFVVLIVLAPLFAQLLKFAISRKREFLADATGADLTGYPEGLASALEKISTMQKPKSKIQNKALNGIYIVSPAVGANEGSNLFSTHPPTAERIKRLREMEFIDQKYVKPLSTDKTQSNLETAPNSMNLVAGTAPITRKHKENGYLVCDKCNGYYELQPGESPADFTDKCECGGKLEYRDKI
ncbi:MAG TPA: M48 family metallopeptidase [Methanobacterium sp.]|nr:M48 family metallopeptidase [Methanobacterium sp.]